MDPLESSVAPAPVSPQSVPGVPEAGGLSQDQMKANLQELMAKIQTKKQDLDSQEVASTGQIKEQQNNALRAVFDMLEQAGVDPSDPEQVKAFLDQIKQQDPALGQQIETAMQSLLGEDPEAEQPAPENNMNINPSNETVPEDI